MCQNRTILVLAFMAVIYSPALARAQDPKFQYADQKAKEEIAAAQEIEWKAVAQAGLLLATGNAPLRSLTGGASAFRKANQNKFQVEGSVALVQAFVVTGVVDGEVTREKQVLSRAFAGRGRYDRFLTVHDALYATAGYLKDEPAGKRHVAGGQIGYSRHLLTGANGDLVSEIGYDFSYEIPLDGDSLDIHSARIFAGYARKLGAETTLEASLEGLFNVYRASADIAAFEDARIFGKVGITTKLLADISLRLGFEGRFDNAPAQLAFMGLPYRAEKLDTRADASVIVNFF
jgi:hypothetical protein